MIYIYIYTFLYTHTHACSVLPHRPCRIARIGERQKVVNPWEVPPPAQHLGQPDEAKHPI